MSIELSTLFTTAARDTRTSTASRLTPQERFIQNIRDQLKLWKGETVLSETAGTPITPTWQKRPNGKIEVGFKFGGIYMPLMEGKKLLEIEADHFEAGCKLIIQKAEAGDYDDVLSARSVEIAGKLLGKKKKKMKEEAA